MFTLRLRNNCAWFISTRWNNIATKIERKLIAGMPKSFQTDSEIQKSLHLCRRENM